MVFAAHQGAKLFIYYFNNHLRRRKGLQHVGAGGPLRDLFSKVLNHLVAHVGLKKGHTHFLHGLLHVGRGKPSLASQPFKSSGELVR